MIILTLDLSACAYTAPPDFHALGQYGPDIGALAKKSNDNALSLVFKIANE